MEDLGHPIRSNKPHRLEMALAEAAVVEKPVVTRIMLRVKVQMGACFSGRISKESKIGLLYYFG